MTDLTKEAWKEYTQVRSSMIKLEEELQELGNREATTFRNLRICIEREIEGRYRDQS